MYLYVSFDIFTKRLYFNCSIAVNFNIDIGANLTDPMYQGIYHGSQKHLPDLDKVLERSWNNNISKIIITAGNIEESKKALEIARTDGEMLLYK